MTGREQQIRMLDATMEWALKYEEMGRVKLAREEWEFAQQIADEIHDPVYWECKDNAKRLTDRIYNEMTLPML